MKIFESIEENPLKAIWDFLSILGGLFGLISFFEDFITWKSYLPQIVDVYQSIVQFPFKILGISLNQMIIDYAFIGSLCGSSFVKAINYGEKKEILNTRANPKTSRIFYFLLYVLVWPLAVFIAIKQVIFGFEDQGEIILKKKFFQWLLAMALIFIFFLLVNIFFL